MRLEGIDHVALYVRDVARSVAWYRDVLGLERRHEDVWGDHPAVMAAGATSVALFPARSPEPKDPPARAPSTFAHVAFRVSAAGLHEARAELRARGVAFEEQDHDIARSIYFRDPDGHEVEITTYETPRRGVASPTG